MPAIVTIGTFDGVHRGHQHLLERICARAAALDVSSVAVTFEPSPAQFFAPDRFEGRLATPTEKVRLLGECGVDRVLVLPFTQELALLTPEAFVALLQETVQIVELWVGRDFAMGRGRAGDVSRLQQIAATSDFTVHAIERVDIDGLAVSSSVIRKLVAAGDVEEAGHLLGRRYAIGGEVIKGAQIGRTIGYPTANVALPDDLVLPSDGIYASYARVEGDDRDHPAMTYIGTRPALNTGSRLIETHLLDFDADLYGKILTTTFVRHLRQDADFVSVDALVAQLQRDEAAARQELGVFSSQDGLEAAQREPH